MYGERVDAELLVLSGVLLVIGLIAFILRSRFLVQLAGGSLAIAVLWKIGQIRGWLMDSKAVMIMYITASLFGFMLGLIVARPKQPPQVRR